MSSRAISVRRRGAFVLSVATLAAAVLFVRAQTADASVCTPVSYTVWSRVCPTTSPSARAGHVMAYDAKNAKTVLFGGCGNRTTPTVRATVYDDGEIEETADIGLGPWCQATNDETWIWNGSSWTSVAKPPGATENTWPHARWLASMAYDKTSQSVILFGGLYQTIGNATPPANAVPCWDDQVVLKRDEGPLPTDEEETPFVEDEFHWHYYPILSVKDAANQSYYSWCFNDTWSWNGSAWTRLSYSPATDTSKLARFWTQAASDACAPASCTPGAEGRVTIFSGCRGIGIWGRHSANYSAGYFGCTEYGGKQGESDMLQDPVLVTSPSPTDPRFNPGYKDKAERQTWMGDTLSFSYNAVTAQGTWAVQCPPTCSHPQSWRTCAAPANDKDDESLCAPFIMTGHAFVYVPSIKTYLLYGGYFYDPKWNYLGWRGRTWAWSPTSCSDVNYPGRASPCWRLVQGKASENQWGGDYPTPSRRTNLASALTSTPSGLHAAIFGGWRYVAFGSGDDPFLSATFYWKDTGDPALPEGPLNTWGPPCQDGPTVNDTSCWRPAVTPNYSHQPSSRELSAMSYHAANGSTVLFGGRNLTAVSDETWVMSGWTL